MSGAPLVVEHRLAVNPATPDAMPRIDRDQLWRGLVMRMRCPDAFLPGLDECRIEQASEGTITRRLRFGQAEVLDRVVFHGVEAVEVEILARPGGGRFRQRIAIEEDASGALWLHFRYEAFSADHRADAETAPLIRAAYRQADHELILRLRQLAAAGMLG
jgi:hypothetical protein